MRDYEKYIRYRTFPTPWCPGCGDGVILKSIAMAFAELKLDPDEIVVSPASVVPAACPPISTPTPCMPPTAAP